MHDPQNQGVSEPQSSGQGVPSDDMIAQMEALQAELQKMKDLAGRSQADLQNAKDRLDRESADLRKFAVEGMLMRLLPTLDNFQRAFQQHLPADLASHEWVKGVQAVEQDLFKQLESAGLTKMDVQGKPVDPQRHEILQSAPGEEGMVLDVFENGYELHGKVLRPAKVKVGSGEVA